MRVQLNGEDKDIMANTLLQALEEWGYGDATIATAVNSEFVAVDSRENTP